MYDDQNDSKIIFKYKVTPNFYSAKHNLEETFDVLKTMYNL